MIDRKDCRFCCGDPVKAEFTVGEGIKTMQMMFSMLTGISDNDPDKKADGIWLENGNMLCFDNSSREYVPLGINIGFCPLCGRELKQEKDPEDEEEENT